MDIAPTLPSDFSDSPNGRMTEYVKGGDPEKLLI